MATRACLPSLRRCPFARIMRRVEEAAAMTNATAMTLSLAIFIALFLAALYIICWGGALLGGHHRRRRQVSHPPGQSRRAA
jgi:hypothetical protein